MKAENKFLACVWLVNILKRYKKITFKDINGLWVKTEISDGAELTRSTFSRIKNDMENMFGLIVDCDMRDNQYQICNPEVLKEHTIQNWMITTLSTHEIIRECLSLKDRIQIEHTTCDEYLDIITTAMKTNVRLSVTYLRYGYDIPSHADFEPYALKLFHQRWYIVAHFHRDASEDKPLRDYFSMYSLDRIVDIQLTNIRFKVSPCFNVKNFFEQYYGVFIGDDTPLKHIVIRAYGKTQYYIDDLKVHETQNLIQRTDDYADYELVVRPTTDLIGNILSWGANIKVLQPIELAQQVKEMHQKAVELYE